MRRTLAIAAVLTCTASLTACDRLPAPQVSRTSSPTATGSSPSSSAFTALPDDLAAVATALYAGKPITARPAVKAALAGRTPAQPASATAGTGTWHGVKVATITAGKDTTLLVKGTGGWTVVGGWWPSLGVKQTVLGSAPRRVLMIGSDARLKQGQRVDRSRGDALQVVGVDGRGGGGLMGIPRDLWVTLPSGRQSKINVAMAYGGPELLQHTVTRTTGLSLDGYVVIGFTQFSALVDELGKVTVTLPHPVRGHSGTVTLSGPDALWVARERKSLPGGDFDRSRNQGLLIGAFGAIARAKGPSALPRILTTAGSHSQTNLTAEEALTFGAWAYRTNPLKVGHRVAKGAPGMRAGQSVVPVSSQARAVFADFQDGRLGG